MACFTLTINTDNAAFEGTFHDEIARILRDIADDVATGHDSGPIYDVNGNLVGSFGPEQGK